MKGVTLRVNGDKADMLFHVCRIPIISNYSQAEWKTLWNLIHRLIWINTVFKNRQPTFSMVKGHKHHPYQRALSI